MMNYRPLMLRLSRGKLF